VDGWPNVSLIWPIIGGCSDDTSQTKDWPFILVAITCTPFGDTHSTCSIAGLARWERAFGRSMQIIGSK
jgi:hypothetical protein